MVNQPMTQEQLDNLPHGSAYDPPERVVCAANFYPIDKVTVTGIRHYDTVMISTIKDAYINTLHIHEEIQGFITSKYRFVNRQEAWKIAVAQHQIVRRVGGDTLHGGTLFSENLY